MEKKRNKIGFNLFVPLELDSKQYSMWLAIKQINVIITSEFFVQFEITYWNYNISRNSISHITAINKKNRPEFPLNIQNRFTSTSPRVDFYFIVGYICKQFYGETGLKPQDSLSIEDTILLCYQWNFIVCFATLQIRKWIIKLEGSYRNYC